MTPKAHRPSRAQRVERAEQRRSRHIIQPEERGHGGSRKRPPLVLPELVLPADVELADFAVPVSVAATLAGVEMQGFHQQIERGTLPAYLLDGRKMIRLDDLAESHAGRVQAELVAEEYHREGWLSAHVSGDACTGRGCKFWAHPKIKRPASPRLAAHLALIRVKAKATTDARRRDQLADIEQVKNRIAAEMAGEQETR